MKWCDEHATMRKHDCSAPPRVYVVAGIRGSKEKAIPKLSDRPSFDEVRASILAGSKDKKTWHWWRTYRAERNFWNTKQDS